MVDVRDQDFRERVPQFGSATTCSPRACSGATKSGRYRRASPSCTTGWATFDDYEVPPAPIAAS
ncbi:hypothetical protein WT08_23135 [Burkholderia sp. MSMB1552]|nr:hypothetical protein WT08_23135 [Burkholderia sp. MSMB1552]KWZ55893.1 hypothetical protein WS92_08195 [Burkholderia sp. MSMB1588]